MTPGKAPKIQSPVPSDVLSPAEYRARKRGSHTTKVPGPLPCPDAKNTFRYGMLHDIESIWWIALWFIFNTTPKGSTTTEGQQEQAAILFSRVAWTDQQYLMIASAEYWNSSINSIPQNYMPVAQGLNTIRMAYIEIANNAYAARQDGVAWQISKTTQSLGSVAESDNWSIYDWFLKYLHKIDTKIMYNRNLKRKLCLSEDLSKR